MAKESNEGIKGRSGRHVKDAARDKEGSSRKAFRMFRSVGSGLMKVLFVCIVMAMLSVFFLLLYHYLLASPYLKLQMVDVKGIDPAIGSELIGMCHLDSDVSLVSLRLNELKHQMEKHPWVRTVSLERRFPDTLVVKGEQEIPTALVLRDKIYYMNPYGEIFKEVQNSETVDLPVVTGCDENHPDGAERLVKAAYVIKLLAGEDGPWSLRTLSEVHVDRDGLISLYFSHLAAEIKVHWEDLAGKLGGLKKLGEHLSQTGHIHEVKRINLHYDDGAVVSFREG